jgi:tRNA (guanine37-N1)-methyltransferase
MKFNILTLFPECFMNNGNLVGSLGIGLVGKAFNRQWNMNLDDLKQYGSHLCRMDDRPAGGGPGMIFKPDKLNLAIEKYSHTKLFFLSPRGNPFNQSKAFEIMNKYDEITLLSGRYETIDQRIIDYYNMEEISIGDYILCGGEVGIQVIMEAIIRLLPGVMNNDESGMEESFSSILLEHNQYTKPIVWNDLEIPHILLSGNHELVNDWKLQNSLEITYNKRPDLYGKFVDLIVKSIIIKIMIKNNRILKFFKKSKKINKLLIK